MRILLILVFTALLSCSAIMAEEVSARHDGLTVSGDGCSVSFSSGRITIRSPYFKAGDIGRFGLLRTIADPYSSAFSLRPEVSLHQRYSRQSGFAAGLDGFIAGASLSGRPLESMAILQMRLPLLISRCCMPQSEEGGVSSTLQASSHSLRMKGLSFLVRQDCTGRSTQSISWRAIQCLFTMNGAHVHGASEYR